MYLEKLLPRATEQNIDLADKIKLEFYKLEKTFDGQIALESKPEYLSHKTPEPDNKPVTEDELLDEVIKRINERYQGKFTDSDRVMYETIRKEAYRGENGRNLKRHVKNNDYEMFVNSIYPEIFRQIAQKCYAGSIESFTKLFEDKEFYRLMMEETGRQMYEELKNA